MIYQKFIISFVIILLLGMSAFSQRSLSRANLGVEYGTWKPSSLDDFPSRPLTSVAGAEPYFGLTFTSPIVKSHSFRLSIMQWRQGQLDQVGLESVTLRHLSADLKYYVLPEYTVSPYASYGVAAIWSRERPLNWENERIPLDRAGWGFNLGAGVDFLIHKHIGFGLEYQYLYAMFSKRVGMTSNYSGPKFSLKFFYIF